MRKVRFLAVNQFAERLGAVVEGLAVAEGILGVMPRLAGKHAVGAHVNDERVKVLGDLRKKMRKIGVEEDRRRGMFLRAFVEDADGVDDHVKPTLADELFHRLRVRRVARDGLHKRKLCECKARDIVSSLRKINADGVPRHAAGAEYKKFHIRDLRDVRPRQVLRGYRRATSAFP